MPLARRCSVLAGAIAGAALLAPGLAHAQAACNDSGKYHLRSSPAVINYGPVTVDDFEAGHILTGSVTLQVVPRGNAFKDWELCVQSPVPSFGPGGKPITDVEWQVAGATAWMSVSTAEQLVAAGNGRADLDVFFRVAVDWDDASGDYDAPLTFKVAQQ